MLSGETVASIALQNGYTEPRFRQINNLGPNDYLMVGQTVITDHCDCANSRPPTLGPTATYGAAGGYSTTTTRPITLRAPSGASAASSTAPTSYGNAQSPTTGLNSSPVYQEPDARVPLGLPAPDSRAGAAPSVAPRPTLYGAPARTMSQLEGRGGAATTATPVPAASTPGRAYGSRAAAQGPFPGYRHRR